MGRDLFQQELKGIVLARTREVISARTREVISARSTTKFDVVVVVEDLQHCVIY